MDARQRSVLAAQISECNFLMEKATKQFSETAEELRRERQAEIDALRNMTEDAIDKLRVVRNQVIDENTQKIAELRGQLGLVEHHCNA